MHIACQISCLDTFNQVRAAVEPAGFDCCWFPSETALLVALRRRSFDLILVDTDKFSATLLCAWLECRSGEKTPLIVLSADCAADEVARAFDAGAEDCIDRPFAPVALVARLKAALRRQHQTDHRRRLELCGFTLDRSAGQLFDRGIEMPLTQREFELAWVLFSAAGRYLSRAALSAMIWGVDENVSNHTIEQHVYMLRKKLRLGAERGVQVRAAYNKGYRLELLNDAFMPAPSRDLTAQAVGAACIARAACAECALGEAIEAVSDVG
jgi:DNA-binding response OmpR family regulator